MPPTSPNPQSPPHPSTPPQSIPLRDLARPPDSADLGDGAHRHNRGRSLLSGGPRPPSGHNYGPRYERLGDASPTSRERRAYQQSRVPPLVVQQTPSYEEDIASPFSAVENPADFQAAMGFAGLLVPDISVSHAPRPRSTSYGSEDFTGISPYGDGLDDHTTYFASESDRSPLTDPNHQQPVSGAQSSTSQDGQRQNRSFRTVSFSSPGPTYRKSRLGDDLYNAEAGLPVQESRSRGHSYGNSLTPESRTRSRSPSTATAFSRAGSIVRAMSQRVVNLSGEAELIEESARREAARAARASRENSQASQASQPSQPPMTFSDISSLSDEGEPVIRRKADPLGGGPNYAAQLPTAPVEKAMRFFGAGQPEHFEEGEPEKPPNPLRGKSLGIFSPESRIRNYLCDVLVYPLTEPMILLLIVFQTILLAVDSSKSVYTPGHERPKAWGHSAIDWTLLGLFVVFTIEIVARVIVSGLIFNAPEYDKRPGKQSFKATVLERYHQVFKPQRQPSLRVPRTNTSFTTPDLLRSFTAKQGEAIRTVEQAQRLQLARRAFLRHSFNRLDLLAVLAFWVAFVLGNTGIESSYHLYVFRMLSCLRILRLLALTHGTAIILRSLKKAAPLLVNVSFLIGFFWLLFAIIGVQSFKSSFDRQCVWVDPSDPTNSTGSAFTSVLQFCGGQFNIETGAHDPYVIGDLGLGVETFVNGSASAKGYLCPRGSYCLQLTPDKLPYNGTVSFDNIFQSLELVFVVMTANTFSDLMYYTMNSDYLAAALFFAGGIIIMMLWLLNLLIAVITSSFQVIREEGKMSAFAATVKELVEELDLKTPRRFSAMKRWYNKTYWFWIVVITYGLLCQALRSATMSHFREDFINDSEIIVTLLLLADIIVRFAVDWRGFNLDKKNWLDLGLAIITALILIPPIRNSGQPYAWLSVFQIVRIYRVIIAVPVTRGLITLVLGNSSGIGNLMLFVFLITFLMSIFAVQLFRGELTQYDPYGNVIKITFSTIYNAFLGMYQILSSENWTTIVYNITAYDTRLNTAWIGAIFFIGWFILANFILVNMFIAVIQENFDVSEDEKRMHQVKSFLSRKELGSSSSNLSLSAIFRFGRSKTKKDPLDYGPATMEMLLKDAVVKDFLDDEMLSSDQPDAAQTLSPPAEIAAVKPGQLSSLWGRIVSHIGNREPNPFYSNVQFSGGNDESLDARTMAKEAVSATLQRKRAQREYLARHPTYNNALFIFKPTNPLRRLCQRIVGPGRGSERFDGVEPNRTVWYTFSAFVYAAIVAMVLLACVTTPLYQKEYFDVHTFAVKNWFVWADMAFAVLFSIEALIKVVADGFFWTPNAYFRSSWGAIDAVVLITFWINVITSLFNDGAVSRAIGAFKALRALRLLNVSDSARDTFHSLIIVGGWKVFSAAFVSLSLLIPFAIYGVNLFNGQFQICNDSTGDIATLANCFGEWNSTPFSNNWPILAPRSVNNPYYNFDNFGSSLFILFQIVSQEGWVDVMWSAESMTGRGLQPAYFASQGNAIFFVVFNLLATIFILTLFISVFMRNYTEQTGVAFLTADQRSWLELRKLLRQVSPSKRPSNTNTRKKWKDWCYKRAVRKHGKWQQAMTIVLVLHLILLLIEYYPEPDWWDLTRTYIFLAFTVFYMANVIVRITGLSWSRFRRSSWDVFSVFAVFGTFASTILLLTNFQQQSYIQLHKLFLVAVVLLLIPRNDALDQLFKTAAASLSTIGNLLATWFVLFLVFAIALTQTFGLTRFGPQESGNLNFRTVPKALILLFRMSCGEGWNQVMEDFAQIVPPLCTVGPTFFESDCGSESWARALFISWNILSMYIFTSLFVSLIYESFSYVYQHSSGLGKVSREEIRRFKQAWATLDPEGTGFISKEQFPRLLGELSGVFEMRIYDQEHSVRRILEDIQSEPTGGRITSMSSAGAATGVNLKALNKRLAQIDAKEVRRSRARYNLFFEEVMVSADVDCGISFTTVLMILAHYNVISDNKSLKLEEFLRRRARLQRVEEEVRRRIVLGFFDTMYWSRRFRKHMEKKRSGRMTDVPQLGPEVYVDDGDDDTVKQAKVSVSPLLSPENAHDPRSSFITHGLDGAMRHRRGTNASLTGYPLSPHSPGPSPQLSPHRPTNSAFSFESGELSNSGGGGSGQSSRRGSAAENVLEVLDNSAWGESIRRSFTMRRPSRGGSS